MKRDERHYVMGDARRILCGCITRAKTSGPIHGGLFLECTVAHHDVWDHRWMTCDTRDAAIAYTGGGRLNLESIELSAGELTAREVMQIGLCTPQCMLALGDDGYDQCRCRCQGEWHGVLADAEVHPWYTVIRKVSPDSMRASGDERPPRSRPS